MRFRIVITYGYGDHEAAPSKLFGYKNECSIIYEVNHISESLLPMSLLFIYQQINLEMIN